MQRRATVASFAALVVAAAGLIACGGADKTTIGSGQTGAVHIVMTEWKITGESGAAVPTVKAGEVTFEVRNDGQVPHDLVIIKTDADPAALPTKDAAVDEAAAGGAIGRTAAIAGGATTSGTFTLDVGTYALICNVPTHYQLRMYTQLIVE